LVAVDAGALGGGVGGSSINARSANKATANAAGKINFYLFLHFCLLSI